MTVSFIELLLYAGGILVLFITPGPVWVAIVARTLSGGFHAAWPLALGVVVGDIIWPFLAIIGVTWVVGTFSSFMILLRWVACFIFLFMGLALIRNSNREIAENQILTKPGAYAGFFAGVAVILGNPKAILFYLGVLPGFFDLTQVSPVDIVAIILISAIIPFVGNCVVSLMVTQTRHLLSSPKALRTANIFSGILLICVGLIIPLT